MEVLAIEKLASEARAFALIESRHDESSLFGATDGKAVGTYLEHKFQSYLDSRYTYVRGNSASGIDFPGLGVDIKVTSITQPQSSCPFKSARQKIYGLGYHLLIFVYQKTDDQENKTARLEIEHTVLVESHRTADFQLTKAISSILQMNGNQDDLIALFSEKNLPVDDITANTLAQEVLSSPPEIGYLTISNALQWRLQYTRVLEKAGIVSGIQRLV